MSDNLSAWEKVLNEISSPWDWVAAGLGAMAGGAVTVVAHGVDLGHSVGAGALLAITARKAGDASLASWRLRKRANGFQSQLDENEPTHGQDIDLNVIRLRLQVEMGLWQSKATDNSQFAKALDASIEEYRQFMMARLR
jgi:hypothetical protein